MIILYIVINFYTIIFCFYIIYNILIKEIAIDQFIDINFFFNEILTPFFIESKLHFLI
jgi:hypothetical protein